MEVVIRRDQETISRNVVIASSFFSRLRGLLFRRPLRGGEGLLLVPCRQVHTFFMGYPIDVIFLDPRGKILEIVTELDRGKISPLVPGSRSVLELFAGTAKKFGLRKGDNLEIFTN